MRWLEVQLPVLLSYAGLSLFIYGFFLTRRELPIVSQHNIPALSALLQLTSSGDVTLQTLLQATRLPNEMEERIPPAPARRRVFLFIVDALRLDFMVHHRDTGKEHSPYNRMVHMQRLLRENSSQCTLFGFRADPPTVTSQRLKSITTGTLPTFIDIGANMNSSAVTDDNVIDQLLRVRGQKGRQCCGEHASEAANSSTCAQGGKMVVLGDDTWGALFPTQFSTAHLYDSFNTRDLDKVDNGILSHIFEHMNGNKSADNDWDLMVAHFLGVDHIGHTHHAFHPLMAERLALMDDTLQRVVAALPEDGVLFLFGDHGMTDAGEHGGSSGNETDSGLFVYSKQPIFHTRSVSAECRVSDAVSGMGIDSDFDGRDPGAAQALYWDDVTAALQFTPVDRIRAHPRMVSQLDLTPTLSLLLGLPVPASSLGMLIPELFAWPGNKATPNASEVCSDALADALFVNAMQVWRYLTTYWGEGSTTTTAAAAMGAADGAVIPQSQHGRADSGSKGEGEGRRHAVSSGTTTHADLLHLEALLLRAVNLHAQQLAGHSRGNSCAATEVAGASAVHAAYVTFFRAMQGFTREKWTQFKLPHMLLGLAGLLGVAVWLLRGAGLAVSACAGSGALPATENTLALAKSAPALPASSLLGLAALPAGALFLSMAGYSDNFTIYEHLTAFALMQGFNLLIGAQAWGYTGAGSTKAGTRRSLLLKAALMLVAVRLQWSGAGMLKGGAVGYVRWSVIGLVALTAWAVCRVYSRLLANTRTFRAHGRAPQEGPLHRVCATLHGLGTAYLLLHWAVQHLQQQSSSALLRIRVALGVLGVRSALLDFLLRAAAAVDWLVLLPRIVLGLHGTAALLAVGALVEGRFRLPLRERSVQLALLLHVYFSAANVVAMFLGPVHGTALFVWVVIGTLFVQSYQQMLHAAGLSVTAEKNSPGAAPGLGAYLPLVALALYFPLSGRFLFFSTAHRMDFGTLQLSAGFVGAHDFHFAYAGAALAANTFGPFVLACLALHVSALYLQLKEDMQAPMKMPARAVRFLDPAGSSDKSAVAAAGRQEESPRGRLLQAVAAVALAFQSVIALHSCCAAAILRRHLMVWRVFAPKMAFEGCIWLAVALTMQALDALLM